MNIETEPLILRNWRTSIRLDSLQITTDQRNVASQRVAEKCGFLQVGSYVFDGIEINAYRLAL